MVQKELQRYRSKTTVKRKKQNRIRPDIIGFITIQDKIGLNKGTQSKLYHLEISHFFLVVFFSSYIFFRKITFLYSTEVKLRAFYILRGSIALLVISKIAATRFSFLFIQLFIVWKYLSVGLLPLIGVTQRHFPKMEN